VVWWIVLIDLQPSLTRSGMQIFRGEHETMRVFIKAIGTREKVISTEFDFVIARVK
jgi:hypothetical protein